MLTIFIYHLICYKSIITILLAIYKYVIYSCKLSSIHNYNNNKNKSICLIIITNNDL